MSEIYIDLKTLNINDTDNDVLVWFPRLLYKITMPFKEEIKDEIMKGFYHKYDGNQLAIINNLDNTKVAKGKRVTMYLKIRTDVKTEIKEQPMSNGIKYKTECKQTINDEITGLYTLNLTYKFGQVYCEAKSIRNSGYVKYVQPQNKAWEHFQQNYKSVTCANTKKNKWWRISFYKR
jgi:hypothetical protein